MLSIEAFESVLLTILNNHAPYKNKLMRANHKPYVTKKLREAIINFTKTGQKKIVEHIKCKKNYCNKLYKRK